MIKVGLLFLLALYRNKCVGFDFGFVSNNLLNWDVSWYISSVEFPQKYCFFARF